MARQLAEACGWQRTPEYLVRDHLFTAKFSSGGFGLWAFVTGQLRFTRLGKIGMRSG
jgi:hypothetical protein